MGFHTASSETGRSGSAKLKGINSHKQLFDYLHGSSIAHQELMCRDELSSEKFTVAKDPTG